MVVISSLFAFCFHNLVNLLTSEIDLLEHLDTVARHVINSHNGYFIRFLLLSFAQLINFNVNVLSSV